MKFPGQFTGILVCALTIGTPLLTGCASPAKQAAKTAATKTAKGAKATVSGAKSVGGAAVNTVKPGPKRN